MNPHQHLQILASTLNYKVSLIKTHRQVIKGLALKTLTVEETKSILAAYHSFFLSYAAKNPLSFAHNTSRKELNEAYAKYQYDLLFEHINLTYRDLVLSKGTPSLLNNILYTAYFDIYSSKTPYVCRCIYNAAWPKISIQP